ncbi:hypothetical protein ABQJ54_11780 [Rhodanobacter sp. Si-c]|uniref:Uncharacterized protein n=1 Tax=Rhodanobacter lycopersici TaxID=3162487 RepID=A0ABV3QF21_9GAMM
MGFFAELGKWIAPAVRVVRSVVEKVDNWINDSPISSDYAELTRKFEEREVVKRRRSASPDFMSAVDAKAVKSQLGAVEKKLEKQSKDQALTNKTLALQTEIMKLAVISTAFDRYSGNIKLHASNLSIHLQTIRNVKGLTDDVNSLRFGLQKAFNKINQMAMAINSSADGSGRAKINQIDESVDIDRKDGAISLHAPYRAFLKSRDLLISEIGALSNLANEHEEDIKRVQERAAELGAFGQQVIDYLEDVIVPKLAEHKRVGVALRREMAALPIITKENEEGGVDES